MVISVCFDNLTFFGQFLRPALGDNKSPSVLRSENFSLKVQFNSLCAEPVEDSEGAAKLQMAALLLKWIYHSNTWGVIWILAGPSCNLNK
jgi:hypothetical protein